MYNYKRAILSLFLLASCTVISSCDSNSTADNPTPETTPNSKINPSPPQQLQNSPTPVVEPYTDNSNTKAISGKTTNVTLYTSDDQCQELIPKKADVSAQEPMNEAIGKIFKEQDTADYSVSGYRININNEDWYYRAMSREEFKIYTKEQMQNAQDLTQVDLEDIVFLMCNLNNNVLHFVF